MDAGARMPSGMKDRLARSAAWLVWSKGAVQLISFLSVLLVARLLHPADYGLMALAGIWMGMMALISEMGLGAAIIQFRDLDAAELNACFWLTMTVATAGYVGLYGAAPLIAVWFSAPRLSDVLRVVGLVLPLMAVRVVSDSLLRKRLAFDRLSQAEIAAVLINVPIVLGLAWGGAGVWALVAGGLVVPLVQGILICWFARWRPGLQVGGARLSDLLRYSLATLGARITWAAYQQADIFVLGKVSGDIAVGYYSMARQLAELPVTKVSMLVNQLATPVMAELQGNLTALRTSFLRGVRLVSSVSLPLCVGMMLVAEDVVRIGLTEKWAASVAPLQILSFFSILSAVAVLFSPVLMVRHRVDFLLRYTIAQLLLMTPAFWAGAAWGGPVGVALAWTIVYPIGFAWLMREVFRELEIGWRQFLAQVKPAALATLVMALTVLLGRLILESGAVGHPVARLGAMVAPGAIVYGAMLWWIGGPVRGEIAQVAGWVVRGGGVTRDKT